MIISVILLIALIGTVAYVVMNPGQTASVLTKDQAGEKALSYINQNLLTSGLSATLESVEEAGGVYTVTISLQGSQIPVYLTKNGEYLFIYPPYNTSVKIETEAEQPSTFDAPDKEVPEVDLYVMSFCPYGVQAENTMKPVVDLLGSKVNFKIRFIANVGGTTVESVSSLHGLNEAKEDLRQVCIQKYYDQTTFWKYLMDINANCYSLYRDANALDACWKNASAKFGIDVAKIETCAYGSEGIDLLKADEALTSQYGISGSPTLLINGQTYTGSRTAEDFKAGICTGFTAEPTECSQALSTTSGTAQGSC
jgi:protein-disulfide isomerase